MKLLSDEGLQVKKAGYAAMIEAIFNEESDRHASTG